MSPVPRISGGRCEGVARFQEDSMEYRTFDDLRRLATVSPAAARGLGRRARLGRWARLLQEDAERRLEPLRRLEFMPKDQAEALRCDNSPISIAFADPVLRAEGLAGDR